MSPHTFRFLAAVLFAFPAAAQTTWYVDVNGTPPGSGTQTNPFTSIQQAVSHPAVAWNDLILVAPGVYAETVAMPSKQMRVRSQGGPAVTWIEPNAPTVNVMAVVNMMGNASSVIDGFTISGAKVASSIGVQAVNSTARNCIMTGHKVDPSHPTFSGSGVASQFDLWLEGCTVSGNAKGFTLGYVSAVYSSNVIIQGNGQDLDPVTFGSISTFEYTLVGSVLPPGAGNLTGDPLFWNPTEGDYRLRPSSPCIDTGDPSAPLNPDGSRRDMGALIYDATYAPGPAVFCTAKTNSQGCAPQIGFSGHATSSGSAAFLVTASNEVPGKSGLLFYGPGKRFQPFQGATHCVQLPTKRVGVQVAGGSAPCSGTYSFDFGAYLAAGSHPALFPGALIACQWWSRDPSDPTGWGTGLSDALFFGVAP
jgi:hypothetical protein